MLQADGAQPIGQGEQEVIMRKRPLAKQAVRLDDKGLVASESDYPWLWRDGSGLSAEWRQ